MDDSTSSSIIFQGSCSVILGKSVFTASLFGLLFRKFINGKIVITDKMVRLEERFPVHKIVELKKADITGIKYYRNAAVAAENPMVLSSGAQSYLKFEYKSPNDNPIAIAGYFPDWNDVSAIDALKKAKYPTP